jgi:DNA-binding transcriptional MocR family regulator
MNWVWDHSRSRGSRRLVLLAMADFADNADQCWPSIRLLAQKTGTSAMTVHRAIKDLVDMGEVRRAFRRIKGRAENDSNMFTLPMPGPDRADAGQKPPAAVSSENAKIPARFAKMARWQLVEEMNLVKSRIKELSLPEQLVRTAAGWVQPKAPAEKIEALQKLKHDLRQLHAAFDRSTD